MTVQAAVKSEEVAKPKAQIVEEIPNYLLYETIDGIPVYYRGYKEVLNKTKKSADIMGYGELQGYLLSYLSEYFVKKLGNKFRIIPGELGLHVKKSSNFSLDLSIIDKSDLKLKDLKNKYSQRPPKIVIEVDTKADSEISEYFNYYNVKTQRLLDFGVEKVVWIFTENEQVMVAVKDKPWLTVKWTDKIEVLGETFSIQQIIDEAEE